MGLNLIEGIADSGYDRSEHRWAGNPTTCFGLWRPIENAGDNAIKRAITDCFFIFCSQPKGEARRREGKRTTPVTESWIPTCAVQRRWLRGRDLNPGPLGYEPNLSMARLCISMIYVEVDLRFSTLFWGILFSTCSSSCSRIVAQRWPNDVGHQTREKAYGSDLPVNLPSNLYNCCGSYRHDRLSEWPHEDLRGARCWATDSLYQLSRPWRGRVLFRLQRDE